MLQLACGSSCAHRGGGEMLPSPAARSRERDARDERRRKQALAAAKLKEWQNSQPHTQFAAFTESKASSKTLERAIEQWAESEKGAPSSNLAMHESQGIFEAKKAHRNYYIEMQVLKLGNYIFVIYALYQYLEHHDETATILPSGSA